MDNKKIIIIGIVILAIACVILVLLTSTVNYERVEITPNGTSMEIPENQNKYLGEFEGIRFWKWNNGALVTYNSHEGSGSLGLTGLGFDAMKDVVVNGNPEDVEGHTFYTVDADELFDLFKIRTSGKFYCCYLTNESTQDNILFCCNDKDMALHMLKSVEYKKVYEDDAGLDLSNLTIEKIADNIPSNISISL